QGMRKSNRSRNAHAVSLPGSPHGAGEVAQAVGGEERSLFEGRNEKRARQMRLVMLDAMELRSNLVRCDVKGLREGFGDGDKSRQHFGSLAGKAWHFQGVHELCSETGPGIARDSDVVDLGKRDAGSVQAIADRGGRKSRGVLHTV